MKITVCDDLLREAEKIAGLCREYIRIRKTDAEVKVITNPEELKGDMPDVLVLDIEMPGKSGIEVKNDLIGRERPLIIFATSHKENMPEAFGPNVIGFMVKPVEPSQFEKMMDCAVSLLGQDQMMIFDDGETVSSRDVIMIRTAGKYTEAVFASGEKKEWLRKSLNAWEEDLVEIGFLRISRSCLVNCRHIKRFDDLVITLKNGQKLEAGNRRKKACFEKFMEYMRKHGRYV